jgi:hypothetical protein
MSKSRLLALVSIAAFLVLIVLYGVTLLYQTPSDQWYPEPQRGIYLHYSDDQGGGQSKLFLVNSEVIYGAYNESFTYSGVIGSYSINKGDPCVIINGTVRNDYGKDYYFAIGADVYNSTGEKIGPILNANSPLPGISVTKIDTNSTGSFEIKIRYSSKDISNYNILLMLEPTDIPPP